MENTVKDSLELWARTQGIGKKPRTKEFHGEVLKIIKDNWPDLARPGDSFTVNEITAFAEKVSHYCPSRWNLITHILKSIIPAAKGLKSRPLRFKHKAPPTKSEYNHLLSELEDRSGSHAAPVVRLLACTGLRISEARQLKWENVLSDCILLPPSITKNGRPRSIPFINGTRAVLDALRKVSPGPFILPQSSCQTALRTACRRAGVKHLSHHDFRHLFATRCIESGVDVPTVARWIGHQDGGALLSRMYFHLLDSHSREMAVRVQI